MSPDFSFARFLLKGGVGLFLVGLVLWWVLPIHLHVPPFIGTSALAIGYGAWELRRGRPAGEKQPPASS